MGRLGIISGTVLLQGKGIVENLTERTMENKFGNALVLLSDSIVFLPRHGMPPHNNVLPHLINHPANFQALKDLGVSSVIGIHSTGSLKRNLKPGMLVIPDDFMCLCATPTVYHDKLIHITPLLNDEVRQRLVKAAGGCGMDVVAGGVYWQTPGPRLETRAEIRMMSRFADLVGMTMSSEAAIAQELELPYASLCTIDNYAHGLDAEALTMAQINRHARENAKAVLKIIACYTETWAVS
jgi:5'-methylthioadenosine phosphorylase